MPPAFRAAGTQANGSGTSISVPAPAGHQAGDLLILVGVPWDTTTMTTPAGWTLFTGGDSGPWGTGGNRNRVYVWWKIAASSSEPNVTLTQPVSGLPQGQMFAVQDVNTAAAIDASAGWGAIDLTLSIPTLAITTVTDNALIVYIAEDTAPNSWVTPPAGATQRYTNVYYATKTAWADLVKTPAGTKTADTYTRSGTAGTGRVFAFAVAATLVTGPTDTATASLTFTPSAVETTVRAYVDVNTASLAFTPSATETLPTTGGSRGFKAAGTLASSSAGTPVVPYPAGVVAGDFLIVQYARKSNVTVATPSGWTLLASGIPVPLSGTQFLGSIYYKIAGASEPSTVTFGNSGTAGYAAGIMSAFTGVDSWNDYNTNYMTNGMTNGTAPALPSSQTNDILLRFYWKNQAATGTITPDTDTERYDAYDAGIQGIFELATGVATSDGSPATTAVFSDAIGGATAFSLALHGPLVGLEYGIAQLNLTPAGIEAGFDSGLARLSLTASAVDARGYVESSTARLNFTAASIIVNDYIDVGTAFLTYTVITVHECVSQFRPQFTQVPRNKWSGATMSGFVVADPNRHYVGILSEQPKEEPC